MVAHVHTIAFRGIEAVEVDVQAQLTAGLPSITVVGLGDKAITESKERVRSAFAAMGLAMPPKRITINLAPADLVKEGTHFDLPIALAILQAMDIVRLEQLEGYTVLGELGLDASVGSVPGVLPAAISAHRGGRGLVCPRGNGGEAALAGSDIQILAVGSIGDLLDHLKGSRLLQPPEPMRLKNEEIGGLDISEIKGQEGAKRALEIAAAGGHSMLMSGPPGSGKSLLASCLARLLPPLSPSEALEVSMIRSLAGVFAEQPFGARPYRSPHHTASQAALVGGGQKAKPGEITLAHRGVLFLDELPEFPRNVLESLRQPLESGKTLVARANAHFTYPAKFQLVAAMNPCRCGMLGDSEQQCSRAPRCGDEYQNRISGPFYDRIDISVAVPQLQGSEFTDIPNGEAGAKVAARVKKAYLVQQQRYRDTAINSNSECDGKLLEKVTEPSDKAKRYLMRAVERLRLSARGYARILRVARTVADLEETAKVNEVHIAEATHLRRLISPKLN